MLTAWGFGGVLGPLLIARIREATGSYSAALTIIGWLMLVSSLLPLTMRGKRVRSEPVQASQRQTRQIKNVRLLFDRKSTEN
jgi:nitrate/nitrite transporter NarK